MKRLLLIVLLSTCVAQSTYKPRGVEGALKGAGYMGWWVRDRHGSLADLDAILKASWAGDTNAFENWIKAHP